MRSSFAPVSTPMAEAEPEFLSQYKHLIQILENPAKTLKDGEVIYSQIENHAYLKKFFGENIQDKSAALQLCKNMSVQFFKRGDIVMAQGDQSDNKLYVILEGKAAIVINFKGPKPPDGAIFDIELQEKIERERQEKLQSQEEQIDQELLEKIIQVFKKDKIEDKKKYIPFGEDPAMQQRTDINKHLRELIENKNSVLKPKYQTKRHYQFRNSSSSLKPPFKKKKERLELYQKQLELRDNSINDPEGFSAKYLDSKKQSISSVCDTPRMKKLQQEQQELMERKFQQQIDSFGNKVNEIGKGTGFGDKALLAANPKQAVRNATIIATTPLLCIIVQRKDFLRVVENFSKEAIFKEKIITKEFKFFKDISSTSLKERLLYYFQDINLLKNEFVCKEGEEGEGFYILAEGKVTLQKRLEDQSNIYYQKYQNISICTIERPTFFCEEIIFSKEVKNKHKYTIQVASQKAHLFYCSKSNFIYKFPKDAIEELQQFYIARDQSYNQLFQYCKDVQLSNEQLKKANEKAINDNVHVMNFQQNKDLFTQMKSTCIDCQVKKVIPKLIEQFESQQTVVLPSNKLQLDEDYDPAIQDFCSKVEIVMKKNLEEREIVKKIITQKKIRTDKRTFKQKQSAYRNKNNSNTYTVSQFSFFQLGQQVSQNESYSDDQNKNNNNNNNDSLDNEEFLEQIQNSEPKLSVDSEEKIKLLRNYFSKGNKQNLDNIDLSLFYNNHDEIYQDSDINLLLNIRKPKKSIHKYLHKKPFEKHEQSEINNQTNSSQNYLNLQNSPKQQQQQQQQQGDQSSRRNSDTSKIDFSNFQADELKTPPPELINNTSQVKKKLSQNELDIGYLDMFKKQQYFYMVRKGAIKIPHNTEYPQVDIKKRVLNKLKKRRHHHHHHHAMDGEKQSSYSFCLTSQYPTVRDNIHTSYDLYKEALKINQSNFTDISQAQNEDCLYTDRTDQSSKSNQMLDILTPKLAQNKLNSSKNESKQIIFPLNFRKNVSSNQEYSKTEGQEENSSQYKKDSLKLLSNYNPMQLANEKIIQHMSEQQLNTDNQIQSPNIQFSHPPESIELIETGNFINTNSNIPFITQTKSQYVQDQQSQNSQQNSQTQAVTQTILSKNNRDSFKFQLKTQQSQPLKSKYDKTYGRFSGLTSPTQPVGHGQNLVHSTILSRTVSGQNQLKQDHHFFLTPRTLEENQNATTTFKGNPNNFQITSLSSQVQQIQRQQVKTPIIKQQKKEELSNSNSNSLNKANKYLNNIKQSQNLVNQMSAPLFKRSGSIDNIKQNEFFFNKNSINSKMNQNTNNQNSFLTSLGLITLIKNDNSMTPTQTSRFLTKYPQIDTPTKTKDFYQSNLQPISPIVQTPILNTLNFLEQMTPVQSNGMGKKQKLLNELEILNQQKQNFKNQKTQTLENKKYQNLPQTGINVGNKGKNEDIIKIQNQYSIHESEEINNDEMKYSFSTPKAINRKNQFYQTQNLSTNLTTLKQNTDTSTVSDYQQQHSLNQSSGNFTFNKHLKKVFTNRQKIFKGENKHAHQHLNQEFQRLKVFSIPTSQSINSTSQMMKE